VVKVLGAEKEDKLPREMQRGAFQNQMNQLLNNDKNAQVCDAIEA
jgi:hypothetical protein